MVPKRDFQERFPEILPNILCGEPSQTRFVPMAAQIEIPKGISKRFPNTLYIVGGSIRILLILMNRNSDLVRYDMPKIRHNGAFQIMVIFDF